MANWIRVARASECPPGGALEAVALDRVLAIFNVEGVLCVLDGVCPHQGGPLASGQREGCIVTCPWHGWQFDVRTGAHLLSKSVVQPSFAVRVEGDWIEVDLGP